MKDCARHRIGLPLLEDADQAGGSDLFIAADVPPSMKADGTMKPLTLRQAPDVILIGEIRDAETMEHAIALAETGHLCLGTLHANSASHTIERIQGIIGFEEAIRNADSANELRLNIKLKSARGEPKAFTEIALTFDAGPTPEELEAMRKAEAEKQAENRRRFELEQIQAARKRAAEAEARGN